MKAATRAAFGREEYQKKTCFKDWEEGSNKCCFWRRNGCPLFQETVSRNFVPYFLYCGSKVFHLKLKYELIENAFFSAKQTVKLSGLAGNFLKNAWIAVKCCLICLHLTIIIIVMRTDFKLEHHVSILHSNGMN